MIDLEPRRQRVLQSQEKTMNKRLLRLFPIGGGLTALSLAFAGGAVAGGGGFPPPGNYTFNDTSAFASYEISPPGPTGGGDLVFLSVDRGLQTFRPREGDTNGSQVITQAGTVLSLSASISSTNTFEFGCWIIPDAAFAVSDKLHSASLAVRITDQTPLCPGKPTGPATALGKGVAPAGGGGGGAAFPLPLDVNAGWTWKGLIGRSHDVMSFKCGDLSVKSDSSRENAMSTSTGTVSGINAALSDSLAQVNRSESQQNIKGTLPVNCSPF
jgi:hypothetical protein